MVMDLFQSTHPVRGGTCGETKVEHDGEISIHPPREGWDAPEFFGLLAIPISIHPPREGWDFPPCIKLSPLTNFNPPTP